MPPLRLAGLAREPTFNVPARKDIGGASIGSPGLFYGIGVLPGSTGTPVTPYTAQQVATVWACEKRLADDIGKLPWQVRRRLRGGGYAIDHDHALNKLFRRPNRWQTPSQCWSYFTSSLVLRGNGYAIVVRGRAGEPQQIIPISPDRVNVSISEHGDLFYQISHQHIGSGIKLHQDNILHAKGKTFDGFIGVSPIAAAQDVIGLAMAAQTHGAVLFRQGAQIKGVIKHPGQLSKEAKEYITHSFDASYGGVQNAHKTAVFEEGMTFENIQMTNEDAQFLETRKMSVVEICRLFGVPPHKVYDLENAHYANIENSEQQYINDTLMPLGNQMAEIAESTLLYEDEMDEISLRLNFDELLRGDRKTRFETYDIGLKNGMLSINDALIDDGRQPIKNGDEHRVQMNTAGVTPPGTTPAPAAAAPTSGATP